MTEAHYNVDVSQRDTALKGCCVSLSNLLLLKLNPCLPLWSLFPCLRTTMGRTSLAEVGFFLPIIPSRKEDIKDCGRAIKRGRVSGGNHPGLVNWAGWWGGGGWVPPICQATLHLTFPKNWDLSSCFRAGHLSKVWVAGAREEHNPVIGVILT